MTFRPDAGTFKYSIDLTMNRNIHTITIFRCLAALVVAAVSLSLCRAEAQNRRGMDILANFDKRFDHLDSLIFSTRDNSRFASPGPESAAAAPAAAGTRGNVDAAIDRRVDAEIGEIKSLTGLRFTGQTYYRLDSGIGIDEEDPVSAYKGKIQAELRWYPFQSALFKRAGRIEEQRIKGRIDRLAYDREDLGMLVERQKEAFRQYSDSLLSGVLLQRIRNLNMLSTAYMYLLENESISSDDLLQILNEKAEAERLLASIPGTHLPALDLSRPAGYFIEVDTAAYLGAVRSTQADLSALHLQMQLLEQQEKNTSYWTEVNAAPFIRFSHYTRPYAENSSNVDAGLVFTIPLSFEFWKKKDAIRARRDILAAEGFHVEARILEAVKAILLDIERYNSASLGEYRRMEELKKYLSLRRDAYNNRVGEYSRLARMKEYNSYLACCEKFIDFQYRRDCCIADLQKFLTDKPVLGFCREIPLDKMKTGQTNTD